jgi:hypothetical protein
MGRCIPVGGEYTKRKGERKTESALKYMKMHNK